MVFAPQSKRLLRDPLGLESPFKAHDVFLPTEIDKLKKLFPLLDTKVSFNIILIFGLIVIGRSLRRFRQEVWQSL